MTSIRVVDIENFRAIRKFSWCPSPGFNCLIGPGDVGKSTVIDAIDLCLVARRTADFTDVDFFECDPANTIRIQVTLGDLDDTLQSLDPYGEFLRGFSPGEGRIEDEPAAGLETVLTVVLTVAEDLEPLWRLRSDRAEMAGSERSLRWSDRVRMAPLRIGTRVESHLSWGRGSVLAGVSEEMDVSQALAQAGRAARESFGSASGDAIERGIDIAREVARDLGIELRGDLAAMLDAGAVSMRSGAIALHHGGIPARALGTGSRRLLAAGIVRAVAPHAAAVLVDEVESGLEPHRIIRFLHALGAKETSQPQIIATTHSPVVVRELSGDQLLIMRRLRDRHEAVAVGTEDALQGLARSQPHAFLAAAALVCEGSTEVGFVRGIDQYRVETAGQRSLTACGVALLDAGGGNPAAPLSKARSLLSLGFYASLLRDSDKPPSEDAEREFTEAGGFVFSWSEGHAIEDELFAALPAEACGRLVELAAELAGDARIEQNLASASSGSLSLDAVRAEVARGLADVDTRRLLGRCAHQCDWFKTVGKMERAAREIVGPALDESDDSLRAVVGGIFEWIAGTSGRY